MMLKQKSTREQFFRLIDYDCWLLVIHTAKQSVERISLMVLLCIQVIQVQ